jgi:diamine N-acetyltransferase
MIDEKYQGRNYGRKAMELVIKRTKSLPKAKTLNLSMVKAEGSPEFFYKKFGFEFTGKIEEGEHVMKLDLKKTRC